jgi:hypothetical protein
MSTPLGPELVTFEGLARTALEIGARKTEQLMNVKTRCELEVYGLAEMGALVNAARIATGMPPLAVIRFEGMGEYVEKN